MRNTTPANLLAHEISILAWDYKSKEYRARRPHKRLAYTTVWEILKKRTPEDAKNFLKQALEVRIPEIPLKQHKEIQNIYKQALKDIEETEEWVRRELAE